MWASLNLLAINLINNCASPLVPGMLLWAKPVVSILCLSKMFKAYLLKSQNCSEVPKCIGKQSQMKIIAVLLMLQLKWQGRAKAGIKLNMNPPSSVECWSRQVWGLTRKGIHLLGDLRVDHSCACIVLIVLLLHCKIARLTFQVRPSLVEIVQEIRWWMSVQGRIPKELTNSARCLLWSRSELVTPLCRCLGSRERFFSLGAGLHLLEIRFCSPGHCMIDIVFRTLCLAVGSDRSLSTGG